VVVAAPGSRENYHMFGSSEFSVMKSTSVFVNIGRGNLVDQEALVQALTEGKIAAAGLDVTEPEPLPRDHPLLSLSNVTIVPHRGSATLQCRMKMVQVAIDNIKAALNGQPMPSEVTL
jgi:glyoxylate reductase